MTQTTITQKLAVELLGFLENEANFLASIDVCASELSVHPVGQAFPNKLIQTLTAIQIESGNRNQERATIQRKLAGQLLKTPAAIRLSEIVCEGDITEQLQTRRREVRKHALAAESRLRTVLSQMTESNAIVTAVLDAVLGAPVDRSRYNADGKPVSQMSHVEGQRVA